jgi:putative transposase
VDAFRNRPLEGAYPYLFLDAKAEKVRDGGRVVSKALVIAHGVHETGRREILGIDVGEAETEAFWTDFLRGLVKRGLAGVQLAISDAHAGLKAAIAKVLGCAWQRCTVHFLRDCLGHSRKDQHGVLAALIRPIFNADSLAQARDRLSEAVAHLDGRLGKVAAMLEDAEADVLAFYAFPAAHWPKLRSTNPLERFNREIGRRTDVVGIFPDDRSLIRLAGMLCIEANDKWLVGRRYLSAESISLVVAGRDDHIDKEIKEEVAQLKRPEPPASSTTRWAPSAYTTSRDRRPTCFPLRVLAALSTGTCRGPEDLPALTTFRMYRRTAATVAFPGGLSHRRA